MTPRGPFSRRRRGGEDADVEEEEPDELADADAESEDGDDDEPADDETEDLESLEEAEDADAEHADEDERPRDSYAAIAPLTLGDINENRRESVARRLRALRERAPRRPVRRPAAEAPEAQEPEEADEETPDDDAPAEEPASRRSIPLVSPAAGAIGHAAGGVAHGIAHGWHRVREGWHSIPVIARRRVAALVIVAALVAGVVLVVVPNAPCQFPGGDACPAPDDAIELVPDDALAYAHADIDLESEQLAGARAIAERLPLLSRLAIATVSSELARVDFNTEVRPWAGGEIAVAVLPGERRFERVVLIEAEDSAAAQAFADGLLGVRATTSDVGGVAVTTGERGAAAAIVDGFLVLGDETAVSALIDPGNQRGTLADSADAEEIVDELPDERLAYAYLSGPGARALFADPALDSLRAFVDPAATTGVGVAVSAADGVLELEATSALDPERAQASPGFFAALPPFDPTLSADVGGSALAYLGLGQPGTSVAALLDQAAADAPALLKAADRFERDLSKETGVDLGAELLPLLGSEAALSVEPRVADGAAPAPGTLAPSGVPYLSLIASGVDADAAARALAGIQKPLADALGASDGARVGGFEVARIAGVDAQSLLVNPDINLTYAVYDDRLVIATSPVGVEQARDGGAGLDASPLYSRVTEDLPEEVSLLAYLDLRGLVSLGEEIGLAADPAYATYATDARALEAAALAVTDSGETIRTDLRLAVGDSQLPAPPAPPSASE